MSGLIARGAAKTMPAYSKRRVSSGTYQKARRSGGLQFPDNQSDQDGGKQR
jgi:hypothetical protein